MPIGVRVKSFYRYPGEGVKTMRNTPFFGTLLGVCDITFYLRVLQSAAAIVF